MTELICGRYQTKTALRFSWHHMHYTIVCILIYVIMVMIIYFGHKDTSVPVIYTAWIGDNGYKLQSLKHMWIYLLCDWRFVHVLYRYKYTYPWYSWIVSFYFLSFEPGIANAISSFKWRKIFCLWKIDIFNIELFDSPWLKYWCIKHWDQRVIFNLKSSQMS